MKRIWPVAIVASALWIVGVSAAFASLLALQVPVAAKILIALTLALFCLIIAILRHLNDRSTEILLFLRQLFISHETLRLDPENRTPARDILRSDLAVEADEEDIAHTLGRRSRLGILLSLLFAAAVVATTMLLYAFIG